MLYRYSTLGKLNGFDHLGGAIDHVDLAEEKEQHDSDNVALVRLTNRDRRNYHSKNYLQIKHHPWDQSDAHEGRKSRTIGRDLDVLKLVQFDCQHRKSVVARLA